MLPSEIVFPVGYQLFYIIVPAISIVGNGSILYVTSKSKRLRSPCNILIFLTSFGEVLHMFAHYVAVVSFNIIINHVMRQDICVLLQLPSIFGMLLSYMLLLSTALDRLFSLTGVYKSFICSHKKLYMTAQILLALVYPTTICIYCFILRTTEKNVFCFITAPFGFPLDMAFVWSAVIVNMIIIICYALFACVFRILRTGADTARSVYRSIFVITMYTAFGWFTTIIIGEIYFYLGYDIGYLSGLFVNTSSAVNVFIYYSLSTEYRREFDEYTFIGKIKQKLCKPANLTIFSQNENLRQNRIPRLI